MTLIKAPKRFHFQRRFAALLTLAALLLLAAPVQASYITGVLGAAGPSNWAILTLSHSTDIALNGPGTTTGSVGILNGTLALNSSNGNPSTAIVGNLFLDSAATVQHGQEVNGTIFTNQDAFLMQAAMDAMNASAIFAGLTPTSGITSITGGMTINSNGGINVLDLTKLSLGNNVVLTLNGAATDQFIINISGGLTLNSGKIVLTGGLTPSDVVFNVIGTGPSLQTSGGLHNESVINGILLATQRNIGFAPGEINGELIAGGQSVHLVSGASALNIPPGGQVPEPSPSGMMAIGLSLIGACSLLKRKIGKPAE